MTRTNNTQHVIDAHAFARVERNIIHASMIVARIRRIMRETHVCTIVASRDVSRVQRAIAFIDRVITRHNATRTTRANLRVIDVFIDQHNVMCACVERCDVERIITLRDM